MDLSQLLQEDLVLVGACFPSWEQVIRALARLLRAKCYVKNGFAEGVLAREVESPTRLPTEGVKIAIPTPMPRTSDVRLSPSLPFVSP